MYTLVLHDEEAELFFDFIKSIDYGSEIIYFPSSNGSVEAELNNYQLSQFVLRLMSVPFSTAGERILDGITLDLGVLLPDWVSNQIDLDACEGYYG